MNELRKEISTDEIQQLGCRITEGVSQIIDGSRHSVAVYLNSEVTMTYWHIGKYIVSELDAVGEEKYGAKIVATVSQLLTARFGKGYKRAAIFRMLKVAKEFPVESIVSTLSRQLTWSHFVELSAILDSTKRLFYQQMSIVNHWSVRQLRIQQEAMAYERSLIAAKPEDEQVNVLTKTTQGDVSPDIILKSSYIVDFLGLQGDFSESTLEEAVIAQLEKFIMELYLKYLQQHEMQSGEGNPVGLLLCSEGNTEHIELLMLDSQNIKVAQYLTVLPDKQWFIDKLNRSIMIARELQVQKG